MADADNSVMKLAQEFIAVHDQILYNKPLDDHYARKIVTKVYINHLTDLSVEITCVWAGGEPFRETVEIVPSSVLFADDKNAWYRFLQNRKLQRQIESRTKLEDLLQEYQDARQRVQDAVAAFEEPEKKLFGEIKDFLSYIHADKYGDKVREIDVTGIEVDYEDQTLLVEYEWNLPGVLTCEGDGEDTITVPLSAFFGDWNEYVGKLRSEREEEAAREAGRQRIKYIGRLLELAADVGVSVEDEERLRAEVKAHNDNLVDNMPE